MQNKPIHLEADRIIRLSQQCVKCGLCLPHCPTYKLNSLEGHSPRGRIALWENLANNNLKLTPKTTDYLEHCLSCGACQNHCPAGVEFLTLQDLGRSYLTTTHKLYNKLLTNWIIKCVSNKFLTKLLRFILFFYQKSRLHYFTNTILTPLPKFKKNINIIYQKLPKLEKSKNHNNLIQTNNALNKNHKDSVIIFAGCINKLISSNVINSAITLLKKLNINPYLINNLHCCGALYTHNGELNKAKKLINNNILTVKKFLEKNKTLSHILTIDTGCHPEILKQFKENNIHLKIMSIEEYLYSVLHLGLQIKPRDNRSLHTIFVYTPCSQREQLKTPNITKDLLALAIPHAVMKSVPAGYGCCGAAGRYMIDHPNTAKKLAQQICAEFIEKNPELLSLNKNHENNKLVLCTSNIGCSLHLKDILYNQYKITIETMHPIELIARCWNVD